MLYFMFMIHGLEDYTIVEIPDPGHGSIIAEQAAKLMLRGIQDVIAPTREQVAHTVVTEMNGHLSLAAINSEGSVAGTGGLLLIEARGIRAAIVNMVVAPEERGHGLGVKIISRLEEEATRLKAIELFGYPLRTSVGFYEKLGYRQGKRPYAEGSILVKSL